jgi:hypothetical protein
MAQENSMMTNTLSNAGLRNLGRLPILTAHWPKIAMSLLLTLGRLARRKPWIMLQSAAARPEVQQARTVALLIAPRLTVILRQGTSWTNQGADNIIVCSNSELLHLRHH